MVDDLFCVARGNLGAERVQNLCRERYVELLWFFAASARVRTLASQPTTVRTVPECSHCITAGGYTATSSRPFRSPYPYQGARTAREDERLLTEPPSPRYLRFNYLHQHLRCRLDTNPFIKPLVELDISLHLLLVALTSVDLVEPTEVAAESPQLAYISVYVLIIDWQTIPVSFQAFAKSRRSTPTLAPHTAITTINTTTYTKTLVAI